jgi:hypothetical protein
MKKVNASSSLSHFSLKFILFYLLSSFFGALIFSILAYKSRTNGNGGWGWIVLSVIFAAVFGSISYALISTSSPNHDSAWYYLGLSAITANAIAVIILLISLKK